jgi:hypothetical protein
MESFRKGREMKKLSYKNDDDDCFSVDDNSASSDSSSSINRSQSKGSSGNDETGTGSDSLEFDIAQNESKAVYRSKLLVLTVIGTAAASFGAATYIFTRDNEQGDFEQQVRAT